MASLSSLENDSLWRFAAAWPCTTTRGSEFESAQRRPAVAAADKRQAAAAMSKQTVAAAKFWRAAGATRAPCAHGGSVESGGGGDQGSACAYRSAHGGGRSADRGRADRGRDGGAEGGGHEQWRDFEERWRRGPGQQHVARGAHTAAATKAQTMAAVATAAVTVARATAARSASANGRGGDEDGGGKSTEDVGGELLGSAGTATRTARARRRIEDGGGAMRFLRAATARARAIVRGGRSEDRGGPQNSAARVLKAAVAGTRSITVA
ncbi:hypothetical protein FGB62_92g120 [Gracilaria domingensis]|nr:hypothetical protein FGB62_92g120 [Gracilaria domingensis]